MKTKLTTLLTLCLQLLVVLSTSLVIFGSRRAHAADDSNDAYDPFIDYNEFEAEDEEEADINFFKNGRLLTAGVFLGDRTFDKGFHQIYSNGAAYGGFLSYFFDLRFALQFSFITSSHNISIKSNDGSGATATGNVTLNGFGVDIKYYFNTQNISKGLAAFNPYILGGFTSYSRTQTVDGEPEFAKDNAVAFDAAAGFEVPIMQKKMYLGAQVEYQIVNFANQGTEITLTNGTHTTGVFPNGDIFTGLGIIGINF